MPPPEASTEAQNIPSNVLGDVNLPPYGTTWGDMVSRTQGQARAGTLGVQQRETEMGET